MRTILIYDGSFNGFLTGIFDRYERKLEDFTIVRSGCYQPEIDSTVVTIDTDHAKSKRVWAGLKKHLSAAKRNEVYKTFLSELPEMETVLSAFILHIFSGSHTVEDLSHPSVIAVTKIAHRVHREKHRMEAFIRFQRIKNGLYFAMIDPDFNVLPLIVSHFKERYADQQWLIYDKRRNYGVNYDHITTKVTEVQVDLAAESAGDFLPRHLVHADKLQYQKLWKDYFHSVNIEARKNMKLHVQHVPMRYWRYLTEKRDFS